MSRLTAGYEYKIIMDASQADLILHRLREGETVEVWPSERAPWRQGLCDWCGKPMAGEKPVLGYQDMPTHPRCQRLARRGFRREQREAGEDRCARWEPPVMDYPNGQGVFI